MWGGVLYYEGEVEVKKTLVKSIKISFQEKTSKGFVERSFDTPKEHLEWQYGTSGAGCLALEPDEKES